MRRSYVVSSRREVPHSSLSRTISRTIRTGLLISLASALVALAGTPANLHEALQAQRSLVAEDPRNADLLNDLGNLLALAGDLDEAEEVYRRALEIEPADVTSRYNLALVLREQGDLKEARKLLQSILESEPRHAWTHYQLGTLFDEQNNRSKAVHHYAEAFAIDRSLTSPKVNPHIVENRLATEALLLMHVDGSPSTQAPRIYEEPGNVADLLLPRQSAEAVAEPATSDTSSDSDPVSRRHRASFSSPPIEENDLDSTGEGTITPDYESDPPRTIDSSTIRSRSPVQPESGQDMNSQSTKSVSEGSQGRPSAVGVLVPTGDSATATDDAPGSPQNFTPSLNSTGRLDLQLLPATESGPAVSST